MMLKAWAQLVRLPNVFTAPADVMAGVALGYRFLDVDISPGSMAMLFIISVCYYAGGMILNDVADVEEDRKERPARPLPSGKIPILIAAFAGFGLLFLGLALGLNLVPSTEYSWRLWPLLILPFLIIAYNFSVKKTPAGPLAMGLCRGCNLMLGALLVTDIPVACYCAAFVNTLYITGVTIIASDETRKAKSWKLTSGMILMALGMVGLFLESLGFHFKATPDYVTHAEYLLCLLVVSLIYLWYPVIQNPIPPLVGRGIKYSIMGLIVINAIHATLGMGHSGLLLLLLLLPALFLGRFIYST